jgi:putative FmdB family regulatory protein
LPTYEYACTSCGHRLDAVQKFSDDPLTECPECGSPLRKVYGNVGIVLKGSGFYKTDSRAASAANGSGGKGAETSNGDTAGGDSTPKKEATPAGGSSSGNDSKSGSDSKSGTESKSGSDAKSGSDTKSAATTKS